MPELPEVEAVRRTLEPWLVDSTFAEVEIRRPDLRGPFPRRFKVRLIRTTVLALSRRAKYILATLSSGETLLIHLGMSGSFRIDPSAAGHLVSTADERGDADRHDHVVFHMSSGATISYNDPRRFGVMDLLSPPALANHPILSRLGPEPLSAAFDAVALALA